jgi:hypothetical protein
MLHRVHIDLADRVVVVTEPAGTGALYDVSGGELATRIPSRAYEIAE